MPGRRRPHPTARADSRCQLPIDRGESTMNRQSWLILSVLSLGTLLVTLDASMILVAIPSVSGGLHATVDQVVWVLTGYTIVFAVLLIPCGRLGDMIERRNLFAAGALLLGAASAL